MLKVNRTMQTREIIGTMAGGNSLMGFKGQEIKLLTAIKDSVRYKIKGT